MSNVHNPVLKQRDQFTLFKNHTMINNKGKIVGRLVYVNNETAIKLFDLAIDNNLITHE